MIYVYEIDLELKKPKVLSDESDLMVQSVMAWASQGD